MASEKHRPCCRDGNFSAYFGSSFHSCSCLLKRIPFTISCLPFPQEASNSCSSELRCCCLQGTSVAFVLTDRQTDRRTHPHSDSTDIYRRYHTSQTHLPTMASLPARCALAAYHTRISVCYSPHHGFTAVCIDCPPLFSRNRSRECAVIWFHIVKPIDY